MFYIFKRQSFQIESKIFREQRNNSLANLTKRMLHDEFIRHLCSLKDDVNH